MLQTVLPGYSYDHIIFLFRYPKYYSKIRGSLSIDGWLGYMEAVNLYNILVAIPKFDPIVVEIGCWQGKSTVVLCKAIGDRPNAKIFCIDPFNAEGVSSGDCLVRDLNGKTGLSLKENFIQNLKRNRVDKFVHVIEEYSYNAVENWKNSIDLLFLDGNHEYSAIRRDFDEWTPFLVSGGVLVMDDVGGDGHPGPMQVAQESIFNSNAWEKDCIVGRHLIATKC